MDAELARTSSQTEAKDTKSSYKSFNDKAGDLAESGDKDHSPSTQQAAKPAEPEHQENVLDFVNDIKATALKNTFQQAGFIYEPTTGLYYDTKSRYYYSPEYDLYYNGNDGNWYRLNPRTNEFTFHSGTEASQAVKKV